jgi:membrane-anchored mycosin MYCP
MPPSHDGRRDRSRRYAVIGLVGLITAAVLGSAAAASAAAPKTSSAHAKSSSPAKSSTKSKTKSTFTPIKTTPTRTTPPTTPPPPQCTPSTPQSLRGVTQAKSGYLPLLKPAQAWPIARGAGVTIALLDTGVTGAAGRSGGALAGRLVDGGNFAPGTDHKGGLLDCDGQGTGDAGLLAATDTASYLPGMAPDATVVSVRVQVEADVAPKVAAVVLGITAAMMKRADVIVLASPCTPSAALATAIKKAVRAGVVVVAAVGDPQTPTTTSYPAMYPGVLGVAGAATGSGSTAATGTFVDLSAPASGLAALSVVGHGYASAQGTARAAALTAGTVALVRSAFPTLKLDALTTRLEYSADHPSGAVPNTTNGWGVIDPYAALTLPVDRTRPPTPAPASHLGAVVLPPPANPHRRHLGAGVGAILLCAALAASAALAGVRRARRRGWRPAHS